MNPGDWKSRLAGFMRGRYGIDELYRAMLALSVFFLALNLVYVLPPFLLMGMLFGIFAAIRVFSRNTEKRAAENRWYLALRTRLKQRALRLINRYRDRKTHRYLPCPSCHTTLRLPRKPGVNHVTCPVCRNGFDVTMR